MWLRVVLGLATAIALGATGCATAACFASKNEEASDRCVSDYKAQEAADREHARQERQLHDDYVAARAPCRAKDGLACLTVAVYGVNHDGDPAEIIAAYLVACDASIAAACIGAGAYAGGRGDAVTALATYRHGCELRDARGCAGAAALDREHAMELETSACELGDYAACYRAGQGHLAAHRLDDAKRLLALACRNGEKPACEQLGRIDIDEGR